MNTRRWLVAAGLTLAGIATAYGQRFGEAVQITVVEVPVTVVDRGGNAVRDLTKDDFELFDEGKKVPIEYFEVVDIAAITAAETDAPPPPVATRNFLLLFDLANSSPGTIGRAAEAAQEFIETQLGERDLAAVAVFAAQSGPRMLTSFTRNRTLLTNAIETLGHPKYFKIADPLMISATRVATEAIGEGQAAAAKNEVNDAIAELLQEQDRVARVANDSEARNRLKIQLNGMGLVARSLDRLKGQKQIILLSEGFDARLVQGRENISRENTQEETDAVFSGEVWKVNQEERFGSSAASQDVSQMAALFRRSDVVLHAIDIKGLRGNTDATTTAGGRGRSNEALFLLTTPTGGTVFKNNNDITNTFSRMLRQQEVVYLLGFTARGTGKPGRFHELRVKAKGGRASHRAGYYEAGTKVTDLEKTLSLAEIMMTDAPVHDVDVDLSATPLPGPAGKARVPVLVEIPGKRLLEGVSGNTATAILYLYAFNAQDEVADFLQQRISLDLAKAGDMIRGSGVRYFGTLRVPPGAYSVKALVRVEESGRVGFVRRDVTVPAFDSAVVLPPLLFAEPANWVMLVGPSRGDEYAYPFTTGADQFIPKRAASVTANQEYKFALFMYRVPLENLEVKPEIVSNGSAQPTDKVTLLGRTSADDRGGIKLLFNFKPDGIPAGEHELRFTVKSKDGNQSVVTIPFRVL
ncbi:MAG TPA: VWA domain-containing protein [Thermoanaerobaculia bacterium]|nr:VWA domain-containing protein [Thermoanaerobaculia bacterium]